MLSRGHHGEWTATVSSNVRGKGRGGSEEIKNSDKEVN